MDELHVGRASSTLESHLSLFSARGEIGDEVHPNVDQFFRIEQGEAKFVFNERRNARCTTEMRSWFRQGLTTT
jgi:mannose-6-phosphate isomerase-like protein (cupin superfamily)